MSALLSAEKLSVALGGRVIVHDVDFHVDAGECVAIIGPNGAGKTTLVRALAGLVPSTGTIQIGDRRLADLPARSRAQALAYLPQGHSFHWPMPVAEIVALGRLPHGADEPSPSDRTAIARAMEATGTVEFADRPITTLSGGERARVALARVLAVEAGAILADEPVAALDPRYRLLVMRMLHQASREGKGVLVVLHDIALAARFADRIVVVQAGRVVADGPPRGLLTDALLRDVFGIEALRFESETSDVLVPWSAV